MQVTIIAPIKHLKLHPDVSKIEIHNFVIEDDKNKIYEEILDEGKLALLGSFIKMEIDSGPVIYYKGDIDNLKTYTPGESIQTALIKTHELFTTLIFGLWLVKDCSAYISSSYIFTDDKISSNYISSFLSSSYGIYSDPEFNLEDMEKYASLISKLLDIHYYTPKQKPVALDETSSVTRLGAVHSLNYNDFSRVAKSYLFLQLARGNSFLPLKITFYAAIFECLFTTDNAGVNHKVAERAAFYLSDNKTERIEIYKFVKKIYDIRSKYVHGQSLDKDYSERLKMQPLSFEADRIIRRLIIKIMEDPAPFSLDNNKIIDWFNDLIFS